MRKLRGSPRLSDRISLFLRKRSDLERNLYIRARQALDPRTANARRRFVRDSLAESEFDIPRSSGFRIFPPNTFAETAQIVAASQDILSRVDVGALSKKGKSFMIDIMEANQLNLDSHFFRFALREDILAAVSRYLGFVPILSSVSVFLSRAEARELSSSQLFHCDGDDQTQIKIFVLCQDVGIENGPTVVMSADRSAVLRRKINYQYRNRVRDDVAFRNVGNEDLHHMTGPAGTSFFLDTSRCFHYGSRIEQDSNIRLVTIIQYLTPFSFMLPRGYRSEAPYRHLVSPEASLLTRLVLGAE